MRCPNWSMIGKRVSIHVTQQPQIRPMDLACDHDAAPQQRINDEEKTRFCEQLQEEIECYEQVIGHHGIRQINEEGGVIQNV